MPDRSKLAAQTAISFHREKSNGPNRFKLAKTHFSYFAYQTEKMMSSSLCESLKIQPEIFFLLQSTK